MIEVKLKAELDLYVNIKTQMYHLPNKKSSLTIQGHLLSCFVYKIY